MSLSRRFATVAAILGLMAMGLTATASLNGYDSLAVATNGAATGPLDGATNGWGWMNWEGTLGWQVQNVPPTYEIVTNSPLQYMVGSQTLVTEGGYAIGGGVYCSAGRGLHVGNGYSDYGDYWQYCKPVMDIYGGLPIFVGKEETNIWASLLVRSDVGTDEFRAEFHPGTVSWIPTDKPRIGVGISNGSWCLTVADTNGGNYVASTGIARQIGKTHLMALNFRFSATNDSVDLYVDPPTLGTAPPLAPTVSVTDTNGDLYFRAFYFYPGASANNGAVDEVRIGDSFATVTPFVVNGRVPGPVLMVR
jgi:hypothetical protein